MKTAHHRPVTIVWSVQRRPFSSAIAVGIFFLGFLAAALTVDQKIFGSDLIVAVRFETILTSAVSCSFQVCSRSDLFPAVCREAASIGVIELLIRRFHNFVFHDAGDRSREALNEFFLYVVDGFGVCKEIIDLVAAWIISHHRVAWEVLTLPW